MKSAEVVKTLKTNKQQLTFFTIQETVQCFVRKANPALAEVEQEDEGGVKEPRVPLIEDVDVVNHLLQEMVN